MSEQSVDPQIAKQNWAGFHDRLAGRENAELMRDARSPDAKAYRGGWAIVEHVLRTPDETHAAETVKLIDRAIAAASDESRRRWGSAATERNVSLYEFVRAAMDLGSLHALGRAA